MKRVLVLLANGAEEMETVIPVDVLRRAGLDVVVAGVEGDGPVECRSGTRLLPDLALSAVEGEFDLIVLPGGGQGSETLAASAVVRQLLQRQQREDRHIAAICAAPIALVAADVGRGRVLTSHPSVRERVEQHGRYAEARVVRDGKLITSRGPGTALEFALTLVEQLCGPEVARDVAEPMLASLP